MTNLAFPPIPEKSTSNDDLAQQITLLAGQENVIRYHLLKLIAPFDENKGWNCDGTVRSCAHWLNWQCGYSMGTAREQVRVARCLGSLPLIDTAFSTGEISYSKVRAMTRVATPENEDYLLYIARHGTASHLEEVVRKYRRVCRRDDEVVEAEQDNARKLVYYQDDHGMWIIHAKLPPEAGALVVKAIEALAKPGEYASEQQAETEKDVSAQTFSEDVEQAQAHRFQQLLTHSRADALVAITEYFLATSDNHGKFQGLKGSERCQVLLHVDINTLREQSKQGEAQHQCCHYDNGRWLSPQTAKRLSCDASLVTVLEDHNGKVLNIGRRSRTVPANIRRALAERDTTCRFPGCCEFRYVDAHHIQHWADGGETSLDNLVTLCRHHHRLLHQGHYSIETKQNQGTSTLLFTSASGQRIQTNPEQHRKKVSAETCNTMLNTLAPHVTPTTCITKWQGEDCDYGMVIDSLLQQDRFAAEQVNAAQAIFGETGCG